MKRPAPIPAERVLRRLVFRPYAPGRPFFRLLTYDTHRTGRFGNHLVGYRFWQCEGGRRRLIFSGEDFPCTPRDAIDSGATCAGILKSLCEAGWGCTDGTPAQIRFLEEHAEALDAYGRAW